MTSRLHYVTASLIFAVLSTPAVGQVDLVNGSDAHLESTLSIFNRESDGNPDWVREYDGRVFAPGIDLYHYYGYDKAFQYRLDLSDLIIQDEDVAFDFGLRNVLGLRLATDKLTHRLDRVPSVNPFLDGTTAAGGDVFTDLAPDTPLRLKRRVWDLGLNLTPWDNKSLRLVANWWEENEDGAQQALFYSRPALPGEPPAPPGRSRFGSALLVDRSTRQGSIGADLTLGDRSSLSYRFDNTKFGDDAVTTPPGTVVVPPVNRIVAPRSDTDSHTIKARSRISDRLYFAGAFTSRSRNNSTSTLDGAGVPEPRTNSIDVNSTNLGLSYIATDALRLTGRYRKYDLHNFTPPVLVGDIPENQTLSRETISFLLEATYTGIRRAFLRGSFERRDVERNTNPFHAPHEEFEHPFTGDSTRSNIWRAGFRYYPLTRFSMLGDFQLWDIDDPGYNGTPTKRRRLNLDATYMASDNFAVYGNYNRWNRDNNDIRVLLADLLALQPGDPGYEAARQAAAGQGYGNHFTTVNLGIWYAVNSKLTVDGNIGRVKSESEALAVIGVDVPFLPHLPPDIVPYDAEDDMWSLGMTYRFQPKWRVYGRFQRSDSDAQSLVDIIPQTPDPGDLDPGPVWTPVSVTENRWTMGFGYTLSAVDQLLLDFSTSNWTDSIDSGQTGRFRLWRLAWARRY